MIHRHHHQHHQPTGTLYNMQRVTIAVVLTLSLQIMMSSITPITGLSNSCFLRTTTTTMSLRLPFTTITDKINTETVLSSSSSSLHAFPNYSNNNSRQRPSSSSSSSSSSSGGISRTNKSKQNYKHTENDESDSFVIDSATTLIPPPPINPPHHRTRNGTASNNRNTNTNNRWQHNKERQRQKNRPTKGITNELFTLERLAPPLIPTDITNQHVISPTILLQNDLGCNPYICGPLQVTYTNDAKTIERWIGDNVRPMNKGDRYSYVGFDVESIVAWRNPKSAFESGPATIQISTPSSSLVIHLTSRPSSNTKSRHSPSTTTTCDCKALQTFLSDPTILKVGAGIDGDMLDLYRYNPALKAKSRFDIGGIGSTSRYRRVGLQNLVRAAVGVELAKSKALAMSDWSCLPLSDRQLCYAGRDAWAGATVVANLADMFPDCMDVNAIGDRIVSGERDLREVSDQAVRRERAKKEITAIAQKQQRCRAVLNGVASASAGQFTSGDLEGLLPDRVVKGKDEMRGRMKRLREIVEETTPDEIPLFDPEEFGLDFAFEGLMPNPP